MKIGLIKCPSPFLINEKVFPPLGLMSVGTVLKQQGHDVTITDGFVDGFDCYGIGPTTPEYPYAKNVLSKTDKKVVLGGPHATKKCLADGFFSVVIGDGEPWGETPFLEKNIYNSKQKNIDTYPIIDRSLVNGYEYYINGKLATSMVTARGCPYKCAFCCKTSKPRFRSTENIIKEIKYLADIGYEALMFYDDTFILNKKRLFKICDFLEKRNIIWRCFVRGDLVTNEIASYMAKSGCVEVGMGIESGSDTILKNINKGETISDIKRAILILKDNNIRIKGFFIVGLPGESTKTIAETDNFLQEAKLDDVDFTIFQPYPNSDIYNNKEKYDIDWFKEAVHYKGRVGEYESVVYTSELSNRDIEIARDELCQIYQS